MSDFASLQKAKESIQQQAKPQIGIVVDVDGEKGGAKVRMYGQKEATNIYFNSLQVVSIGDKVFLTETSGTKIILGKLQY